MKDELMNDLMPDYEQIQLNNKSLNSAYKVAEFDKFQTLNTERKEARDTAIFQTAKNTETQIKILNEQLSEAYRQNETLQKNYETLNNLYKKVAQEIVENKVELEETKKREKKSCMINIISLFVAIFAPIISIISSVLIAICLKP